jgi:hypothetical protein
MGTKDGESKQRSIPEVADQLFATPLGDFVKARDRLARELEAMGSDEEVRAVRALKKPTAPVWAINQAARLHPEKVQRLLDSYRKMQNPKSAAEFREASSERHRAVRSLLDATAEILDGEGHSASGSVAERVTRTLLAAATDEQAQLALSRGHLERELEPSDFAFGMPPPPPAPGDAKPERDDLELRRARRRAEEIAAQAEALAATARELEQAATDAELELESAMRAADRARKEADRGRRNADKKRQEADKALEQVAELQNRARG